MKRRDRSFGFVVLLFGILGVLSLTACGDSPSEPELEISIQGPIQGDLTVGDQVQLQAVLSDPSATGSVTWSSSDTSVAVVSQSG